VTISLFSLYLMNFTFHIMLDASGVVLSVHYKSMKCDVLFSQGRVRTLQYLGEVDIFSYMSKTFLPLYNSAKIIKIDGDFPKLRSQMYCQLFYGSQCIALTSHKSQRTTVYACCHARQRCMSVDSILVTIN